METVLAQTRDAARRGAWREALALFARLDAAELLPEDLEALADAAWWLCRIDESIAARQNAYAGYLAAANTRRAAYSAWLLSLDCGMTGEPSAGSGWLSAAQEVAANLRALNVPLDGRADRSARLHTRRHR